MIWVIWFGCGFIIMILVDRYIVLGIEWVIKVIVLLVFCYSFSSVLFRWLCMILFSVLKGLFISRILVLKVSVWVMLVCCCILFDNCQGNLLLKVESLIRFRMWVMCC